MKYLLNVNALLARAHSIHSAYPRVAAWMKSLPASDTLHTCSIVELGFIRISVQAKLQPDVASARAALAEFKASGSIALLPDDLGADRLPAYVVKPAEITDGHLLALARRQGARLATLDTSIPGASLIT